VRLQSALTRVWAMLFGVAALTLSLATPSAWAGAQLLIEADTGKVLYAENATYPWHPASVTKLMTAYVGLRAVKDRRLQLDRLLTVSANAVAQSPTKMGFRAGTQVTVDNALKMMMVKSANDMAVVIAEGVAGSIENFAAEMNSAARRLGMSQSTFVNPNGLPADRQTTSARDLAILARALIHEFPEYDLYWRIPAIKLGKRVMRNYNTLIDRYPGADGMKTGFICASGFNLVASATRGNRRLIAVVLGAPSSNVRAERAARLLEKGFNSAGISWLMPSLGTVDALVPVNAEPPDLHDEMCGKNRRRPASESEEESQSGNFPDPSAALTAMTQGLRLQGAKPGPLLGPPQHSMPPIEVFVGAAKKRGPAIAIAKQAPAGADGTRESAVAPPPAKSKSKKPQSPATKKRGTPPAATAAKSLTPTIGEQSAAPSPTVLPAPPPGESPPIPSPPAATDSGAAGHGDPAWARELWSPVPAAKAAPGNLIGPAGVAPAPGSAPAR
jgi:D-alanyl-D-alanine carboxypeptidase